MSQQNLAQLVERLEKVVARLETVDVRTPAPAAALAQSGGAGDAPALTDFENYMADHLNPFLELSKKIGGDVVPASEIVKKAFDAQRDFIAIVARCKKPSSPADLQKLLLPTSEQITAAGTLSSKTRGEFSNHLQALAAGLPALGWVTIEKTPAPFVKEMLASAQFYSNKVLVAYKGKDQQQVDWAKAFSTVILELEAYVKRNFLTGITWNAKGDDPMAAGATSAAKPPAAADAGGAPPPPPPPPPAGFMDDVKPKAGGATAASAVFAEINKGNVTSGLRHVTKEMKTKNQPRSESQPVPDRESSVKEPKQQAAAAKKGTPKFQLDGNKWRVEYQDGNKEILIDDTSLQQTVYIYRCNNSVIQIKGKINCITLDDCSRCGVVFENAVSSCELVNSKNVEIQCTGKVPSVSIDKCSGVQLFVSKDSLDVSIVSSKSDQMNILRVREDGDVDEVPIPEQYCTTWDAQARKWVTSVSSHV